MEETTLIDHWLGAKLGYGGDKKSASVSKSDERETKKEGDRQ